MPLKRKATTEGRGTSSKTLPQVKNVSATKQCQNKKSRMTEDDAASERFIWPDYFHSVCIHSLFLELRLKLLLCKLFKVTKENDPFLRPLSFLEFEPHYTDFQSMSSFLMIDLCYGYLLKVSYANSQALNTVLAFVSSKRQLATSFSAVRSSVEGLLKQYSFFSAAFFIANNHIFSSPLEVTKVAEIKCDYDIFDVYCIHSCNRALLPDLVKFSYIPFQEFQAENNHKDASNRTDGYSNFTFPASQQGSVLVLDFFDSSKNKRSSSVSTTSA